MINDKKLLNVYLRRGRVIDFDLEKKKCVITKQENQLISSLNFFFLDGCPIIVDLPEHIGRQMFEKRENVRAG